MSTAVWVACALAAAAALVVVPPHPGALLARRLDRDAGQPPPGAVRRARSLPTVWMRLVQVRLAWGRWSRTRRLLTASAGVGAVVLLTAGFGLPILGLAVVTVGVAVVATRLRRARSRARAQQGYRAGVVELCDVMAAELRAGRTLAQALAIAVRGCPELAPVLAPVESASRFDGDVPAALRAVDQPGTEGLGLIAAAWEAAEDSGAALAEILDRVGDGLRSEEELRREVRAQLSAPRATARLLALLPAFGLLLGAGMGTNPLGVLFGTPYGLVCLVLGGGLAALGLVWVERLARRAEALR